MLKLEQKIDCGGTWQVRQHLCMEIGKVCFGSGPFFKNGGEGRLRFCQLSLLYSSLEGFQPKTSPFHFSPQMQLKKFWSTSCTSKITLQVSAKTPLNFIPTSVIISNLFLRHVHTLVGKLGRLFTFFIQLNNILFPLKKKNWNTYCLFRIGWSRSNTSCHYNCKSSEFFNKMFVSAYF